MNARIIIAMFLLLSGFMLYYWTQGPQQALVEPASAAAPAARALTETLPATSPVPDSTEPAPVPEAPALPDGSGPVLSPEDEPLQQDSGPEINIGPLIDPEHDDPNLGLPPSEPKEIGELLDPETYIPPAPANEKEINIGPLLPPPGEDSEPWPEAAPEQPKEIGKPIDAAAEVEQQQL